MPTHKPQTDTLGEILKSYGIVIVAIPIIIITSLCPLILYLSQDNFYSDIEILNTTDSYTKETVPVAVEGRGDIDLVLEIADETEEQRRGLMNRSSLEKNRGMLFIFEDAKFRSFWMKNTKISLDIAFLDQNKKIINIERDTIPLNTQLTYDSSAPAEYVIETNAGWFINNEVSEGDVFIFYSN